MSSERFVLPAVKSCVTTKSPRIPVRMNRATTIKPLRSFNGDDLGKLVKVEAKEYNSQLRGLNASIEQQLKNRLFKMFQGQRIVIDKTEREQASHYARLIYLHNEKRRMTRERNELRRHQIQRDFEYLRRQKEVDAELASLEFQLENISRDIAHAESNQEIQAEITQKESKSADPIQDTKPPPTENEKLNKSDIPKLPQIAEVKVLQASKYRDQPTVQRRTSNLDETSLHANKNTDKTLENGVKSTSFEEKSDKQSEELPPTAFLDTKESSFIRTPGTKLNVSHDGMIKSENIGETITTDYRTPPNIHTKHNQVEFPDKPISKVEELRLWRKKRHELDMKRLTEEPFNMYACDKNGNLMQLEDPMVVKDTEKPKEPTNRKVYDLHKYVDYQRRDYLQKIHAIEDFVESNYKAKVKPILDTSTQNVFSRPPLTHKEIRLLPKSIDPDTDEARMFLRYLPKYGPTLAKEMVYLTFDE